MKKRILLLFSLSIILFLTIACHNHTYTEHIVSPSCTEDGYTEYVCAGCGDTYRESVAAAMGHDYVSEIHKASCTEDGYTEYVCAECGDTYHESVAVATGHDYASEFRNASCNAHSVTVLTCRICGVVTEQENEQMGSLHDYKSTVVYPDQKNGGYTKYECCNCDTSYTDHYTDPVDFSVGLAYTRKGDVYYVSGMGSCKDRDVIISPVSEQGYSVAGILSYGLNDYRINSVTVRDGVHDIHSKAFAGCVGMTTLTLPALANVQQNALYFLPKLTTLTMPMAHPLAYYFEGSNGAYDTHYMVYQSENGNSLNSMIPLSLVKVNVLSKLVPYSFSGCKEICEISLDSDITVLPSNVFYQCSNLTTVNCSDALTTIRDGAFGYCKSITALDIPETVTRIEAGAFAGTSLKTVTLPPSLILTANDTGIFCECPLLEEVIFKGNVSVIPAVMFEKCVQLSKITLPDSVKTIGSAAFANCEKLYYFKMPSSLTAIESEAFFKTSLLSVDFPNTLKSMGRLAFSECKHLKTVDLENTAMTKIPESAFAYCIQLCSVNLPKNLTSIGAYAFDGTDIDQMPIVLPKTLTYVGYGALQNANIEEFCPTNAVQICAYAFSHSTIKRLILPEGTQKLEYNAFSFCASLEEVVLPTTLTKIDYSTFEGCTGLKSIRIPEGVLSLESTAFQGCTALEEVSLPSTLTIIESNAFTGCSSLREITIPAKIQKVGFQAFKECISLKKVVFGGESVWLGAFMLEGAKALETLVLPHKLKEIPSGFCNGAISLQTLTIPVTVTSIDNHAFFNCTSLEEVDFSDASVNLKSSCFKDCTRLTRVKGASSLPEFDKTVFAGTPLFTEENGMCIAMGRLVSVDSTLLPTRLTVPSTVIYINSEVFRGCKLLEEVMLPEGLTYIGEFAFADCLRLLRFTFPNSLETLPNGLLQGVNGLEQIVLGSGVQSIHESAFPASDHWYTVVYPGSMEQWRSVTGYDCVALSKRAIHCTDGIIQGVAYTGQFSNVKVTVTTDGVMTFSGKGIAGVYSDFNFESKDKITKIVFEEGVEYADGGTHSALFCKISNLKEVVFPSTYTGIRPDDFKGTPWYENFHADASNVLCVGSKLLLVSQTAVGDFTMPQGVTSIADYAFSGCKELTAIHLPEGLLKIGKNAFSNCEKLVGIQIPNSVSFIGNDAFQKCNAITELIIPSGVKRIGYLATSCLSLKRIEIKGETQIEYGIASYCPALEIVIIGEGVESLPINTLYECPSLKYVFLPQSLVKIDYSAFWNTPVSTAFLCPDKAVQNLLTKIPGLSYVYSAEAPTVQGLWWRYGEDGSIELYS